MNTTTIIGGGIAALATAWTLVQRGERVRVLEANTFGSGTTHHAAGMLAPTNELEPTERELLQAGLKSKALYAEWAQTLPDFGFDQSGTLELALTREDVSHLRRRLEWQQAEGLNVSWLSGAQARELEPAISTRIPGGIHAPEDWQVDNRKLAKALANALANSGAQLHTNARVSNIEPVGDKLLIIAGGSQYETDQIVVAIGVGAGREGIHPLLEPPRRVYPVQGQMMVFKTTGHMPQRVLRYRSRAYGNGYIVPKADRLVVGSTAEERGFTPVLTGGGLFDILRKAYAVVPDLQDWEVAETYAGLRPATDDRLPIIERHPELPIVHLNGLYRHGILLAPWAAQQAAALLAPDL